MIKFTQNLVSKLAIAAVLGAVALAHPAFADSDSSMADAHGMKGVDQRIRELHDTLSITQAQEPEWKQVSSVMRRNEAMMHRLVEARNEKEDADAVEDLKSYEMITRAHEEGMRKLVPVFARFYNTLSDDQKDVADDMFGQYEGHDARNQTGRMDTPDSMTPAAGDVNTNADNSSNQ
jgi:hypothetical protein